MKMEGIHSPETPASRLSRLLADKIKREDFFLEEGETREAVIARAELLKAAVQELPSLAPKLVAMYRRLLSDAGITEERTGKLGCVVVGGRAHDQSQLKTYSDIDLVLTAEKPFTPGRTAFISKEDQLSLPQALSHPEYQALARGLLSEFQNKLLTELNGPLSERVGRSVDITDPDSMDGGLIEIKGYGDQRSDEVEQGVVIYTE